MYIIHKDLSQTLNSRMSYFFVYFFVGLRLLEPVKVVDHVVLMVGTKQE